MQLSSEPHPGQHSSAFLLFFAATRPPFLTVTFVAVLIGLGCAFGSGIALDPLTASTTMFFALAAHAGINVINDYYDAQSGADAANVKRIYPLTGGSRFIQNEVLSPRQTAILGYSLLVSVIVAGLWLTWQSNSGLILIGLMGLFSGWAYSAPPLRLMSRGIGEVAITAGWLLIVVGTDYVQRGQFSLVPVCAGLSYALLVANVLYINQFPDHEGDTAAGKKTLVVRLGPETAKWGYLLIAIFAYGWLVAMIARNLLPQYAAAAALTIVISFSAARQLISHAKDPSLLRPALIQTILAANLHGLVLAGTLAFGRWPG